MYLEMQLVRTAPLLRLEITLVVVGLLCLFFSGQIRADIRHVPDPETYQDFLLAPWKANKASLVVFKDPSCPYCVRDLKNRSQLENYNVFMFWAPILGERSVEQVNAFFKCESPSGQDVLEAVIKRNQPGCKGSFKKELFELNNKIVENYDPNSVPQYWLGGRQVSLARLDLSRNTVDADSIAEGSPLKVDWSRYKSNALNEASTERHNIGVVLPDNFSLLKDELKLLASDKRYNWYLFSGQVNDKTHDALWCSQNLDKCTGSPQNDYQTNSQEFKLLAGLDAVDKPKILLEGKELINREKNYLIPRKILMMLSQQ